MTVMVFTQYRGATPAQATETGRRVKQSILRHGAIFFRMGQVFAGEIPGTWALTHGYSDWAAFGRAHQAMAQDSEYQAVLAGNAAFAAPVSRALHQWVLNGGIAPGLNGGTVSLVTFYKGGALGDFRSAAAEARDLYIGAGASDYLFTRIAAGTRAGQWMSSARFADWAAYGTGHDKAVSDPGFAALLARVAGWAEMTERMVITWTDV